MQQIYCKFAAYFQNTSEQLLLKVTDKYKLCSSYWGDTAVKSQSVFTCSKLTKETLEQSVKYAQS